MNSRPIASVILALTLLLGLLRVDAQIASPGTLPKGWNKAACPAFIKDACTFEMCYKPTVGYPYKFSSFVLKKSTVKVGKNLTEVVNVKGESPAVIGSKAIEVKKPGDCCWKCATTLNCVFWQWIPQLKRPCYLLTNKIEQSCEKPVGTSAVQRSRQILIGGKCNAA